MNPENTKGVCFYDDLKTDAIAWRYEVTSRDAERTAGRRQFLGEKRKGHRFKGKSPYQRTGNITQDAVEGSIREIVAERKRNEITEKTWWNTVNQLSGLLRLPKNWDGNDADPPTPLAVGLALEIISNLATTACKPEWICPTGDSGISFMCDCADCTLTWDIDHDGDISLKVDRFFLDPEFRMIAPTDIDEVITELIRA